MPIPAPDEFHIAQLEELLSELTPEQRRLFADWIEHLTFYCRELFPCPSPDAGIQIRWTSLAINTLLRR